jgi:hypothetical protein
MQYWAAQRWHYAALLAAIGSGRAEGTTGQGESRPGWGLRQQRRVHAVFGGSAAFVMEQSLHHMPTMSLDDTTLEGKIVMFPSYGVFFIRIEGNTAHAFERRKEGARWLRICGGNQPCPILLDYLRFHLILL